MEAATGQKTSIRLHPNTNGGRQMANVIEMETGVSREPKFGLLEKEQLAAQMIAVLDAHFKRPDYEEKLAILETARQQIEAMRLL
ncbi:hypothetical protein FTW19_04200 [Terriglobus albidus]|uniref:Uncharacterized protein n=1 Tax=Terriglobus albidus TaxID=1592106 RepID=A0A5B9E4V5_9BACT|nr:hypothetical protein [Terriglobus albidus]QEE27282.1 hypothetical protein FTW19_04200 [Terriglobus albidus]